jgi:hypothetical protein
MTQLSGWLPIESAPKDGTIIRAGVMGNYGVNYPLGFRWQDGRWCAMFGEGVWRSVDPQPTHWKANS